MEIKLNVSDDRIKDFIEQEVNALTAEDLKNVFLECVREYFTKDDCKNLDKVLFKEERSYYGSSITYELNSTARELFSKCDTSSLQEIVDKALEDLKENHHQIMMEYICSLISTGIQHSFHADKHLENTVREIIQNVRFEDSMHSNCQ